MSQNVTVESRSAATEQEAGSSKRGTLRNRSLLTAATTSGLAKAAALALNTFTIPLMVRSLGAERYGLWTAVTSISSILVFADFGLSNGLVTVIAAANGRNDRESAIRAVSSVFFTLLGFAVLLCSAVLLFGQDVPWVEFFNLQKTPYRSEVALSVVAFLSIQVAMLPAMVAQKIQMGYQEMHYSNLWQIAGSVFSAIGVVTAAHEHWPLPAFILLFSAGPLLAQALNSLMLFTRRRVWLAPRLSQFSRESARRLAGTGTAFVILQLFGILGNALDPIILTRTLGLNSVAQYSIAQRMFAGASLIQFFLIPLWPAFGESLARGDHEWARRALRKCLTISLALSLVTSAGIAFALPLITHTWVPEIRTAPPSLLIAFVVMSPIAAYGGVMSSLLNNEGTLRPQLVYYATASITAFVLKIVLVNSAGVSGVVWGSVLGYGTFYIVPAWRLAKRTLDGSVVGALRNGTERPA